MKKKTLLHVDGIFKPIFHCDAKPLASEPCVGLHPQRNDFKLPIPTCWYLKTLKFVLPQTQILKFALAQRKNPNTSQWNIGCVGYQTQNFRVGHVHFMFFVLISFAFGSQHKPSFQWNMGFNCICYSCRSTPTCRPP